jgi:hypothetical protein
MIIEIFKSSIPFVMNAIMSNHKINTFEKRKFSFDQPIVAGPADTRPGLVQAVHRVPGGALTMFSMLSCVYREPEKIP